ncbi:unnamed protein product [Enterobius vermicularis]|uniref:Uncharacterized protein n=1 Tax=Enterobius vermicularis TaxID=51028 RepID=A0A0N4V0H8_ENTVE|nr:unnamed protein product [Enterobius vermicularis]
MGMGCNCYINYISCISILYWYLYYQTKTYQVGNICCCCCRCCCCQCCCCCCC